MAVTSADRIGQVHRAHARLLWHQQSRAGPPRVCAASQGIRYTLALLSELIAALLRLGKFASDLPWSLRFSAWTTFRLLAYLSSVETTPRVEGLQQSLFGVVRNQLDLLNAMREENVRAKVCSRFCLISQHPAQLALPLLSRTESTESTVAAEEKVEKKQDSKSIFYFEVTIKTPGPSGASCVCVGLTPASYGLTRMPGWDAGSFAVHGDDGGSACSSLCADCAELAVCSLADGELPRRVH